MLNHGNIYQSLESSNSLYNQQFSHQIATNNLNQILAQENQNDAAYLAVSGEKLSNI